MRKLARVALAPRFRRPLDLAPLGGVADLLGSMSVAAVSVNIKPDELSLLADMLHDRHSGRASSSTWPMRWA